jgi:hypothetical protein
VFYFGQHGIVTVFVSKINDFGDFFISLCFVGDGGVIDNDLGMEDFLFYPFVEVFGCCLPATMIYLA